LDGWCSTCNCSACGWPPIVITSSLSHHHCPIAVVQLPSLNRRCRCRCHTTLTKALLLSRWQCAPMEFSFSLNRWSTLRTTVASANHNDRNQALAVPPCPLSIRLIAVSSGARLLATCLYYCQHCCCATVVALLPLVCRPLRFAESLSRRLHLLSRYCAPLVQLVVMLPGGLPPPLSWRPRLSSLLSICWLLRCITFSGFLAFPPPLIMPLPLVAPLLFGWLLHRVAWRPGLFPPLSPCSKCRCHCHQHRCHW
jgi:hypothetical protein